MAEEVKMEPVEMTPVAAEPPKVDPLGGASETSAVKPGATVTALKPGLKLPPKPGATVTALRPGLKLPPKPGATVAALKPGLKLPPKPGATVTALKPGLKLPTKPGATATALKPGLKLPTKPVIHKSGATVGAAPLPKPIMPLPKPVTPATPAAPAAAEATPAAPAAEVKPLVAPAPAPVAPTPAPAPVVPVDAQGVGKLPTVAAQAIPREEIAAVPAPAEGVKPMEALKSVTQKLKGVTQAIPQQAILRKTGIIAEGAVTEAQKEAAKHKTARISLSDAMGVAPVKDSHAPMKTIRIKRPVNIPGMTSTTLTPQPKPEATAPAVAPEAPAPTAETLAPVTAEPAPAPAAEPETTVTQRKTLKIARPTSGAVRPAGKFGLKRPGTQATTVVKKSPVAEGETPPADGAVGEIADMPADIPAIPPMPVDDAPAAATDTTPSWLYALSALVQAAAVVMIGALAWFLYQNTTIQYF